MEMDLSRGFVAFPRGLTGWEWYDDLNTRVVFFHLMLTANWDEKRWRGIVIPAGGQVTSVAHLARDTGLSARQIRTALEHLASTQYITVSTTSKYSVVTINRWLEITGRDKVSGKRAKPTPGKPHESDKVSDKVHFENLCVDSSENSHSGHVGDKVAGKQTTNDRQTSDNNQTIKTIKTNISSSPLPPSQEACGIEPQGGTTAAAMPPQGTPESAAQGQTGPERAATTPTHMPKAPGRAAAPVPMRTAAAPAPQEAAASAAARTPEGLPAPEQYWAANGLGRATPALRETLNAYRAQGVEDALLVAAMREAAEHNAKAPLPYIRTVLDKAVAAGQLTLTAWQAGRRPRGGGGAAGGASGGGRPRVDRAEPSGNDFLKNAAKRRPLKKGGSEKGTST